MIAEAGKAANALGGKTARACDSCLKKRARWFCAADDAFLCQSCDTFVHSANQLASRHERVRLETSSSSSRVAAADDENIAPKWHQGFTRKARTPRNTKPSSKPANSHPLVPEISGDDEEASRDETDEQILCRVPVFEPELCSEMVDDPDFENIIPHEFIASDAELAEFAADVESLLGTGFDDDVYGVVNELGNHYNSVVEDKRVKMEANEEDQDGEEVQAVIACHFDPALDMAREALNWDFPYSSSSPLPGEEEEVKVTNDISNASKDGGDESKEERRMMSLKLNYETVITAWASQGSPWADGTKPEFNPDDCWPDFMSTSPGNLHHPFEGGSGRIGGGRDEEREARVLRYREKRRTRLFSKKIRYEVRKLNAEKRPRMKGRFVKRSSSTSFAGPSSFPNNYHLVNNK